MADDSGGEILMEYTIIAGVNGAGKSTLFNAGYLAIPRDSVRINSDELIQKNYNNRWRDVNIQIAAGKQMLKLIRECISGKISFNQETTLSGGNMQKVVAAREFELAAEVLIAEQPTRGVDIGAAKIIHDKILALRANGCAVLLISADLGEIMRLCDRLIVLYAGKIAAYFDDASTVTEEELGLYMLGLETHSHDQIARAFNDGQMD